MKFSEPTGRTTLPRPFPETRPSGVVRAAVVGATGYAGREIVALLARHPAARLTEMMSSGRDGSGRRALEEFHPALRGLLPQLDCHPLDIESFDSSELDVVFLATPHETSVGLVPLLLERGLLVVDLSGAFRLKDDKSYPRWYGFEHKAAAALEEAVYGSPELNSSAIRQARLVANPGCYATSVILALAPLLRADWVEGAADIVCDSKSGASGAGRAPSEKLHFAEVNENCRAYGVFNHRHVPEILQALDLSGQRFTFVPHLLPITRGILSTVYVRLTAQRTLDDIVSLYQEFYQHAPLVRLYADGALPEIQAVAHTNYADLGFALDPSTQRLVVVSAIDNLGKGAAGQAIQNMNLMLGLPEDAGLR